MEFKPLWTVLNAVKIILFLLCCLGCNENVEAIESISKEHKMIVGKWFESESVASKDTSFWDFRMVDLKWRSFEHYYSIEGSDLKVSNIAYRIQKQTLDTVVLVSPESKILTLIRCKSVDSQINP